MSFSINTGYPALTGTRLDAEIDLVKFWGLSETHLTKAIFNAARNAFLDDKKKKELQKELRKVKHLLKQYTAVVICLNHRHLEWRTKWSWRS